METSRWYLAQGKADLIRGLHMRLRHLAYLLVIFMLAVPQSVVAQKKSSLILCSDKKTGAVLLRQRKCKSSETSLSNISALRGAAGPKGDTGAQGIQGIQGPTGAAATACEQADVDGVCLVKIAPAQGFLASAQACAAKGADLCSDSQSWVLREHGVMRSLQNWTRSFADNDATAWAEVNGGVSDSQTDSTSYYGPCCRTVTPSRTSDQTVGGIRVVFVHDVADADWRTAATMCAAMKADLCDKSQYIILRNNSVVSARMWSSDHSDNDSTRAVLAIGNMPDNPGPASTGGFACCATRTKTECPVTETDGVCVASINNTGANFTDAAADCASQGGYICSISQSAILRASGALSAAANWTGSGSDNDTGNATVGVGNAADDPEFSDVYGYACCR